MDTIKRLRDVADVVMGQSPPGTTYNEEGEGLPFYQGVRDFGYRSPEPRVFCTRPSRIAQGGDVLLSVRAPIGRVNVAERQCAIGRGLCVIRPKSAEDARYLEFVLRYLEPTWHSIEGGGSVFGNATREDVESLTIPWPDSAAQRGAIAGILGALDDKIALNRRLSRTLEAMAQALFQSWFVDFDPVRAKAEGRAPEGLSPEVAALFPSAFQDSELGEIPEGWEVGPFTCDAEIVGGGTPRTSVPGYWGGDVPWFSVADTPAPGEVFVLATQKTITQRGLAESSARLLPVGATILSARGTVGNVALVGTPMAANQSCYGLRAQGRATDHYLFLQVRSMVDTLRQCSHGSVFATVTRATLESVQVVRPPASVIALYERTTAAAFDRLLVTLLESRSLQSLRDTLLPQLLSGSLRIPDAKRIAGRCS